MKEQTEHKIACLSFKVWPSIRAEYIKIAEGLDMLLSQWLADTVEMSKHSISKIGCPTAGELQKEKTINDLSAQINLLQLSNKFCSKSYSVLEEEQTELNKENNSLLRENVKLKEQLTMAQKKINTEEERTRFDQVIIEKIIANGNEWNYFDAFVLSELKKLRNLKSI
jgi:chromosome segregation ATPase